MKSILKINIKFFFLLKINLKSVPAVPPHVSSFPIIIAIVIFAAKNFLIWGCSLHKNQNHITRISKIFDFFYLCKSYIYRILNP